jgi:hypothetical protein
VDDPGGLLLGWTKESTNHGFDEQDITGQWWQRWVAPAAPDLLTAAQATPDLLDELLGLMRLADGIDARADLSAGPPRQMSLLEHLSTIPS